SSRPRTLPWVVAATGPSAAPAPPARRGPAASALRDVEMTVRRFGMVYFLELVGRRRSCSFPAGPHNAVRRQRNGRRRGLLPCNRGHAGRLFPARYPTEEMTMAPDSAISTDRTAGQTIAHGRSAE